MMSDNGASSTVLSAKWKQNTDGTWCKVLISPATEDINNWAYSYTKDQQELLAAEENSSFFFHGATKAVDINTSESTLNTSFDSEISPIQTAVDPCNKIMERLSVLERENIRQRK